MVSKEAKQSHLGGDNGTTSGEEINHIKEELEKLRLMITSSYPMSSIEDHSNLKYSFTLVSSGYISTEDRLNSHQWLLDSRAIDHMTLDQACFTFYTSCKSPHRVLTTNRKMIPVIGMRTIYILCVGYLSKALHVSLLSTHLIS